MVEHEVGLEPSPGDAGGDQGDRVGPGGHRRLVERDQAAAQLGTNPDANGHEGAVRDDADGPIGLGGEDLAGRGKVRGGDGCSRP